MNGEKLFMAHGALPESVGVARRSARLALNASERKVHDILDILEDAYYEVDLRGNLMECNRAFCRLLGYEHGEVIGKNYREMQPARMSAAVFRSFQAVHRNGKPATSDWEMLHKDGSTVVVEGSIQPAHNDRGEAVGFRGILRDVTARRQFEQALRDSEARFRALTELSSDWYWEQDTHFRYTRMESHLENAGSSQSALIGKCPWDANYHLEIEGGWTAHRELLAAHRPFRDLVMYHSSRAGETAYVSVSGEPIFKEDGSFAGYRGFSRDITGQKIAEGRIQHLATHDVLTGLPNRVMFSKLLETAIAAARPQCRSFAVLFIDLDRFKFVNDTLGHHAGDILLQHVATRFRKTLQGSHVIARLGGDEFVVLTPSLQDSAQAALVARKILAEAMIPITVMGRECRVSASIGIAIYPQHGDDEQVLMKNADIAMYAAKEDGKNNYRFFSTDIRAQLLERMTMETALRHALERNELRLNYQAKCCLATGAITGVEALLRWDNPELGSIAPAQFIPLAEETKLIIPIGKWVLRTACIQNMAWQKMGLPPVCIAVNLSVRQFGDERLVEDISAILKETGMAPHLLELEITEGLVIHNPQHALALLTAIHDLGVRLAIDDFGAGYSSLGQLKHFPIDTLKLDRSFICDLISSPQDKAITEAMIMMGKTLNLTVVAEGVETQEQEAFLRARDCDEMQGFYFSRPVPPDAFAALLRAQADR